eukprot:GGOE01040890.1.p1 GENE.GGOE01040890.1~~GGOE01040890.1.p1  ORF type:complete len:378 (-),score=149.97 GGOE01040890.1:223-1356(-)
MAAFMSPEYLENENRLFERAWEDVRAFILGEMKMCGPLLERVEKLLDYTCKGGKMTRAKTITRLVDLKLEESKSIDVFENFLMFIGWSKRPRLEPSEKKEDDPVYAAAILGWCIEIAQAYFLTMDDIVDHSETRRFQPCWYKLPNVGVGLGIIDSSLLRSFVFLTLQHFLGHKPYYHRAVELFTQVTFMTEVGEMLDTISEQKKDFQYITEETYFNIIWHKTCYYTIHLPMALGLLVAGDLDNAVTEAELKEITFLVGEYFQIQDDILDCFADPAVIGKVGTDIQDFKCSWLATQFLKKANPEQRALFEEHYGKDNAESIAKVKALYEEVDMKKLFEDLEEDYGKRLSELLPKLGAKSTTLQQGIEMLWKVTYKRKY